MFVFSVRVGFRLWGCRGASSEQKTVTEAVPEVEFFEQKFR